MNQFSPLDPMAMWRELTAQWEKSTNEFANEAMASDPFRQGMHGGMNASLTAQKALGDLMARYLTLLNLPTRADLQVLGEQLQRQVARHQVAQRLLRGERGIHAAVHALAERVRGHGFQPVSTQGIVALACRLAGTPVRRGASRLREGCR